MTTLRVVAANAEFVHSCALRRDECFSKAFYYVKEKLGATALSFFHDDTELSGKEVCGDFTQSATLFLQVLSETDRAVMKVSDKLYGSGPILTGKVKRNMFIQFLGRNVFFGWLHVGVTTLARQLTRYSDSVYVMD